MPPFISVENLTKRYGPNVVIEGLTLEIAQGEIVVFQGPSGIGKSTFLRCLTYLEPFQSGRVRVGNIELLAGLDERRQSAAILALRKQVGFVFQSFNLFPHLTVLENLTIGPRQVLDESPAVARDSGMALLERVGLAGKADAMPNALSGGQQQRVGIARALAMHPKGILFDEPTSSLDPAMKSDIVAVMEEFSRDKLTMLIVTHEPALVQRIAHRLITFGPLCVVETDTRS